MTPILQVITEYCAIYVDDTRLSDLASTDAPLYARRMYDYFKPAISLFKIPAEMPYYLFGDKTNKKFIEPSYDSTLYTLTEDYISQFTINLGTEYTGYEICACRIKEYDINGNVVYTTLPIEYNAETGIVTIDASIESPMMSGTILDFDFYTDGYFVEDLSFDIMNILGMCFQCVWQDRFNTDWLSNVTKVEDKTFFEQNRANKMRADTERLIALRNKLFAEMRRFEQNVYYKKYVINKVGI